MIKVLLCIAVNILSATIGIKYSNKLKRQERFFFDLVSFCNSFKANLDYFRKNLYDFTKDFCTTAENDFCEFAEKKLLHIEENQPNWIEKKFELFSHEQKEYASAFFDILGKSDSSSQKYQIEAYQKYFEQQYENAKKTYLHKGKMYTKLGVLAGIFISVMIV